jgi:signal transduction histidine kinase
MDVGTDWSRPRVHVDPPGEPDRRGTSVLTLQFKDKLVYIYYHAQLKEPAMKTAQRKHVSHSTEIQQERSRLARDIHDGAAQYLIYVQQMLSHALQLLEELPQHPEYRLMIYADLGRAAHSVEMALAELRQYIIALTPPQLQGHDLPTAIRDLLADFMLNSPGLTIAADLQDMQAVPRPLAPTVFRLIQEALHNIYKHAQASTVALRSSVHAGVLLLEIGDNGKGLTSDAIQNGLRSLRERAQDVGGTLEVESRPERGTTVRIRIPL